MAPKKKTPKMDRLSVTHQFLSTCFSLMGGSINGGTPKWLLYKGKPNQEMDADQGYSHLWKPRGPSLWAACVTLKRWFGFPFLEPTQLTQSRPHPWCCHPVSPRETTTIRPKICCQQRIQPAEQRLSNPTYHPQSSQKIVSLYSFLSNLTGFHRLTLRFRTSLEAAEPGQLPEVDR